LYSLCDNLTSYCKCPFVLVTDLTACGINCKPFKTVVCCNYALFVSSQNLTFPNLIYFSLLIFLNLMYFFLLSGKVKQGCTNSFITKGTTLKLEASLCKIEPPQRLSAQDLRTSGIKVLYHVREVCLMESAMHKHIWLHL
jgi:hypothetical protein